jgi:predicted N-acetyltransferase YhbS
MEIRHATIEDLAAIHAVGVDADRRFRDLGLPDLDDGASIPEATARRAINRGDLWVAVIDGAIVGWVYVGVVDGEPCIGQISVQVDAGRRGVGGALMATVINAARARGAASIVLNTELDVPWNGPWYARLGFEVVPPEAWSPALHAITDAQRAAGLSWDRRVHMRLHLRPSSPT